VHDRRVVTMQHGYKIWVALSESALINCVQHPLTHKSRWCHIWLEIKPLNLGNHTSQIKSFYATLLGSHGHLSKSVLKMCGGLTMTSYPACNKTSSSRKPCIPDKTLLWNVIRKLWCFFRIRHVNSVKQPLAEKSRWRHIRLAIKPRYLGKHASQINGY